MVKADVADEVIKRIEMLKNDQTDPRIVIENAAEKDLFYQILMCVVKRRFSNSQHFDDEDRAKEYIKQVMDDSLHEAYIYFTLACNE